MFFLPSDLFLQLGAEQQVRKEEDVAQLPGSFHQLHHEAVLQQLAVLRHRETTAVGQPHKPNFSCGSTAGLARFNYMCAES